MSTSRLDNLVFTNQGEKSMSSGKIQSVDQTYGIKVFNQKAMRKYLTEPTYKSLMKTIQEGGKIDSSIATEVAKGMKRWAMEEFGATHYTHWFQPLTGLTAEKHDSFLQPDGSGGAIMEFDADVLIQGEPDASSFPSGGLRPTFEARGYTGWDPTSPAFIKEGVNGTTLCIPTYFVSWKGEALDKKTPLLRSMGALVKQINRLADILGIPKKTMPYATLGGEQEYFLIDEKYFNKRMDLVQTGRTLFGRAPAKHQQLADHYFGAIKDRVIAFMEELDTEMWKLGSPIKTRHNEVAPAQYEVAPIFENQNLAVDHNMLLMEMMQKIAKRQGLACLLHEKPFYGVNGSGKHNNWSVTGPDGKNWFSPGQNPHENERFLIMVCAIIQAVDLHAGLLRASIASAANDNRLGSHEAPPAIISIYLGEQLTDIIEQIEKGGAKSTKQGGSLEVGVDSLPPLPRAASDRNRTSPFAFTGNKFEFRAVGSSMSLGGPNIVLNTIVADAVKDICDELEKVGKKDVNSAVQKILQKIIKDHKRVVFNGDGYTEEWVKEAKKRGLPNFKTTPEALEVLDSAETIKLFERHSVLSKTELKSRYDTYKEGYATVISYEANLSVDMARMYFIPTAFSYLSELSQSIAVMGKKATASNALAKTIGDLTEKAVGAADDLEKAIDGGNTVKMKETMKVLRKAIDSIEGLVPANKWPVPSYAEMLFLSA